jgi:hypothetical protein
MTSNHPTAGTEATPTVSGILNLLQTKGKRQHVSIICQTLSLINLQRIINYPITNRQHNDNSMLLHAYRLHQK